MNKAKYAVLAVVLLLAGVIGVGSCSYQAGNEAPVTATHFDLTPTPEQLMVASSQLSSQIDRRLALELTLNTKRDPKPQAKSGAGENLLNHFDDISRLLNGAGKNHHLEQALRALLEDNNVSRQEKLQLLSELLAQLDLTDVKGFIFLEYLAEMMPIELTDQLLELIEQQTDPEAKLALMGVVEQAVWIADPEVQSEDELLFIAEKIGLIKEFMAKQISVAEDDQVFAKALVNYTRLAEPQQAVDLITDTMNGVYGESRADKVGLTQLLTETALADFDNQEAILPAVFDFVNSDQASAESRERFNDLLMLAANSEFGSDMFSPSSQQAVYQHLRSIEPALGTDRQVEIEDFERFYFWSRSTSQLSQSAEITQTDSTEGTDADAQALQAFLNGVLNQDNPLKIASLVLYADDEHIAKLVMRPDSYSVFERLNQALADDAVHEHNRVYIRDALTRLTDS